MKPHLWRRSTAGKYLRHLPRIKQVRGSWLHRKVGDRLVDASLWQPSREPLARGLAIGVFFSMLPIPFQMLPAAITGVLARANVPAALAACWITNPITFPLFLLLQIQIGFFVLRQGSGWKALVHEENLWTLFYKVPGPLIVGSLLLGAAMAVVAYFCALGVHDWVNERIRRSAERARSRRRSRAGGQNSASTKDGADEIFVTNARDAAERHHPNHE